MNPALQVLLAVTCGIVGSIVTRWDIDRDRSRPDRVPNRTSDTITDLIPIALIVCSLVAVATIVAETL